jgi:hypothetical protein
MSIDWTKQTRKIERENRERAHGRRRGGKEEKSQTLILGKSLQKQVRGLILSFIFMNFQ